MDYLERQLSFLKKVINEGFLSPQSPLLQEQKEIIIDTLYELSICSGSEIDKGKIGLEVDKRFADELGVE